MRKLDIPAYKIQAVRAGSQGCSFQILGLFSCAIGNVKCELHGRVAWELHGSCMGEGVYVWQNGKRKVMFRSQWRILGAHSYCRGDIRFTNCSLYVFSQLLCSRLMNLVFEWRRWQEGLVNWYVCVGFLSLINDLYHFWHNFFEKSPPPEEFYDYFSDTGFWNSHTGSLARSASFS